MKKPFYLVVGLGKTGQSIARYLKRRGYPFAVFDTRVNAPGVDAFRAAYKEVDVFLESLPDGMYPKITEIITSPGVPLDNPFLQKAKVMNIPIIGDIECLAREVNAPIIGITGTNGKSTVTTLVGEMAVAAGLSVAVAGNIGTPVLDLVDSGENYDLWVLELSSFQLDLTTSLAPIAATILNISPDHLDRHHSLADYIAAKHNIFKNTKYAVYNREDEETVPHGSRKAMVMTSFGLSEPASGQWGIRNQAGHIFLAQGDSLLLDVADLKIQGRHNWQNALAAAALAFASGIDKQSIVTTLKTFSGLPHRCQWVRTLDEVQWINDSKGTNIGATISAIYGIGSSLKGRIVLIAGGLGKGADFSALRDSVTNYVRSVVVIGTDAAKIEAALRDLVPIEYASSFEQAISLAKSTAEAGDVVLLSPACASLDMFKDFNHRGEQFTALVNEL